MKILWKALISTFYPKVKVGQIYELVRNADDPFEKTEIDRFEVVALRKGWVKYRMLEKNQFVSTSKLGNFRFCYTLKKDET